MEKKQYSKEEKTAILKELGIIPLEDMIDNQQAARILSKRAEIEVGQQHIYKNDTIRWRIKNGLLPIAREINNRMKLVYVDDVFALEIEPQKWHSVRGKSKKNGGQGDNHNGLSTSVRLKSEMSSRLLKAG